MVSITRGHSTDHRPDLRQVMFGLVMEHDGVPVVGRVLDGNTADQSWFGHLVANVRDWQRALPAEPLEMVGDAALITEANVTAAAARDIVVTGRLPRTVAACLDLVAAALSRPHAWENIGAVAESADAKCYQAQRVGRVVLGVPMHVGVYRAATSQQRAHHSVTRRAERTLVHARKEAKALAAVAHHCTADAEVALTQAESRLAGSLLRASGEVLTETTPIHWGRGRPPKSLQGPLQQSQRIALSFEFDPTAVEAEARDEGCFVVMHAGKAPRSAAEILRTYKGQASVERRFPFIKDAAWTNAFFVKTPEHVEALGYVLLMALLLWAMWERRVRRNLAASGGKPLREFSGIKHARPTAQARAHPRRTAPGACGQGRPRHALAAGRSTDAGTGAVDELEKTVWERSLGRDVGGGEGRVGKTGWRGKKEERSWNGVRKGRSSASWWMSALATGASERPGCTCAARAATSGVDPSNN